MSQGYPTQQQGNGLAVAGLILGIIALILAVAVGWVPCVGWIVPVVPTLLAIVFGFVGKNRANQGAPNGGAAVAGLVLGILALVATVGFQVFWGAAIGTAVQEAGGLEELGKQFEEGMQESMDEMKKQMEEQQKAIELQIEEGKPGEPKAPGDAPADPSAPAEPPAQVEPAKDPAKSDP